MRFSISLREHNRNCRQEAGGGPTRFLAKMNPMEPVFRECRQSMRLPGWMMMLMMLTLEWLAGRANARAAVVIAPHTTLVVFADRPMPEEQWTILAETLRQSFDNLALETHLGASSFEVVRGDTLAPGTPFEEVISVYLHGNCRLELQPEAKTVQGALGWVLRDQEQIRPFIHVDCVRISEMLGAHVLGMDKNLRNAAMAEAVSRVILHEWLHIATQNPAHSREGIEKRSFGLQDLVPDYPQIFSRILARR